MHVAEETRVLNVVLIAHGTRFLVEGMRNLCGYAGTLEDDLVIVHRQVVDPVLKVSLDLFLRSH